MEEYYDRVENSSIDLKEMIYRILLKWRKIIVCFICFGLVFGFFSAINSFVSVKKAEIALVEQKKQGNLKEGEELVIVPDLQILNPTLIVGGGFVGVAFVSIAECFKYLTTKKLRHEDDMREIYDLFTIAYFPNHQRLCKKKSKVDQMLYREFWKEESVITEKDRINLAVTDCVMTMAQKGYKSVCFISSVSDDLQYVNEIVDKLSQVVKTCILEKSITSSAKSLQSIPKYECVVVVEHIDKSLYVDISRELEYCIRFNISVLGSIVIG